MTQLKGTLKHGVKIGDGDKAKILKDYILRPATTADYFAAEDDSPITKHLSFKGAMIGRQLVKLGDLSGPIDFKIIGKMEIEDFNHLVDQLKVIEDMGKETPSD